MKNSTNKSSLLTLMMFSFSLISCSSDPETIIETVTITETVTVTTVIPTPDTETVGSRFRIFLEIIKRVITITMVRSKDCFLYLKLVDPLV